MGTRTMKPMMAALVMALVSGAATLPLEAQQGQHHRRGDRADGPRVQMSMVQALDAALEHADSLRLGEEAVADLEALRQEAAAARDALEEERASLRQEVRDLPRGDREARRDAMEEIRERHREVMEPFMERFHEILTEDQRAELRRLMRDGDGHHRPHGPRQRRGGR